MKIPFKVSILLALMSCKKEDQNIAVTAVELDVTSLELQVGETTTLSAMVLPDNASNLAVEWNTSEPSVVLVDKQGAVTAISVGTSVVRVTTVDGSKTASCLVKVVAVEDGITVEPAIVRMTIGSSQSLKTTVKRADKGDTLLVWSSADEAVAMIDATGTLTAVDAGATEVTAKTKDGKYSAVCKVSVIDVKLEYVCIPAGRFMMGSPVSEPGRDEDEAQHVVELTKDFQLSKYEITNTQFCGFLNVNNIGADGKWLEAQIGAKQVLIYENDWGVRYDVENKTWLPTTGREEFPVVGVTWYGAMEFATWVGGFLPTEAQWEYACRGDYPNKAGEANTLPFGVGGGKKLDYSVSNFLFRYSYAMPGGDYIDKANVSPAKTQKVGTFAANNYGLCDMHGNVWEWCSDGYDANYGMQSFTEPATDPAGAEQPAERVIKGGSWYFFARACRSAFRHKSAPETTSNGIGFRVAHL